MTTNNIPIKSSVSPAIHARLKEFMAENDLTESEAIATILTTYLGASAASASTSASESINRQKTSQPTPSDIPTEVSMSLPQLAQYLKCSPDELARIRDYPVVLTDYTKDRDPQGRSWEYDPESQRFFPME